MRSSPSSSYPPIILCTTPTIPTPKPHRRAGIAVEVRHTGDERVGRAVGQDTTPQDLLGQKAHNTHDLLKLGIQSSAHDCVGLVSMTEIL
jgi:hypothetical protein